LNIREYPYFHQVDVPVVDTEDLSLVILAHGLGEMAKVAVPETVPVPVPEPPKVGSDQETGDGSSDDMASCY